MSAQLAPSSNVIALPGQGTSCSDAEFSAAIEAEYRRHASTIDALYARRAGMRAGASQGAPVAERRDCKKAAASELRMTQTRLMRLIAKYHTRYEDRPKLAVQPAGLPHTQWIVFTDRVKAIIDSGEPY